MTLDDFTSTLADTAPPGALARPLAALWWAKKNDWDKAHAIVMDDEGADAAWVHAWLHRVEGDLPNARYLVPAGRASGRQRRAGVGMDRGGDGAPRQRARVIGSNNICGQQALHP
jgi:hypothetical protein